LGALFGAGPRLVGWLDGTPGGTGVESFTHQRGHRVLRIIRKGGKASTEPLAPIVLRALEDYVAQRTTGPLFLNADSTARLSYSTYAMAAQLRRSRTGADASEES
jgi:integrase/recombinase XerD